jgi:hypothetical protein
MNNMGHSPTLEELVNEAQQALQRGDQAHAHACYTVATQLSPADQDLWWQRAETANDSSEATRCLEQILRIDPENARARERLLISRLSSLQEEAKVSTDPSATKTSLLDRLFGFNSPIPNWRMWIALSILVFCTICGLAIGLTGLLVSPSLQQDVAASEVLDTPTLVVLQLPQTWTPEPTKTLAVMPTFTPTPVWKTSKSVTIRSGPGTSYSSLGVLPQGSLVKVTGRAADGKFLQIEYAAGKIGWIAAEFVDLSKADFSPVPILAAAPTIASAPKPAARPTAKPTDTPVPQFDFVLGRGVEYVADCSRPWKAVGTVYDSQSGGQRLNGLYVRIWAFNQIQGTVTTGSGNWNMPGYWEWSFNRSSDVVGQVALVNQDGGLRSQPVGFHLTANCDGSDAANQVVIDMVGKR